MAAVIEPVERRGEAPVAAGATLGAAADTTRDALERAELAAAVQGAPGLGMVLQEAAARVEGPQSAVLGPGDDGGRLILTQGVAVPDVGATPGTATGAPDLAAMRRVAGLLGLAEAGRATGEALGQHYLGEEGLAARRIGELVGREQVSPWSEQGQAIGEALGPPSLWSVLRGEGQTEYANGLLSLKAGREVDFRTLEPAALADLIEAPWPDAAGIGRHAAALAAAEAPGTGVEGFPDQSDLDRDLRRPPAHVPPEGLDWQEGYPLPEPVGPDVLADPAQEPIHDGVWADPPVDPGLLDGGIVTMADPNNARAVQLEQEVHDRLREAFPDADIRRNVTYYDADGRPVVEIDDLIDGVPVEVTIGRGKDKQRQAEQVIEHVGVPSVVMGPRVGGTVERELRERYDVTVVRTLDDLVEALRARGVGQ